MWSAMQSPHFWWPILQHGSIVKQVLTIQAHDGFVTSHLIIGLLSSYGRGTVNAGVNTASDVCHAYLRVFVGLSAISTFSSTQETPSGFPREGMVWMCKDRVWSSWYLSVCSIVSLYNWFEAHEQFYPILDTAADLHQAMKAIVSRFKFMNPPSSSFFFERQREAIEQILTLHVLKIRWVAADRQSHACCCWRWMIDKGFKILEHPHRHRHTVLGGFKFDLFHIYKVQ